jgi:CHAT domain-containing protein
LEFWTSKNQIAVVWCTHDRCGATKKQVSEEQLNNVLKFLRNAPGNLGDNWRQQVATLGEIIPALPQWPNVRSALIVPDGWLSAVPFELAPTADGALFIDHFDVSYLPTAALLRRGKARADSLHWPWQRQLIAFGDPIVRKKQDRTTGFESGGELQRLPYAAEEIRSVARMADGRVQIFIAESDRKTDFLAGNANGAPVLHVASHAFADADNPEGSRIEFSSADTAGGADYVFLRELYDLDLSGIDLATLSACDTERGKMIRGEGVQAFGRALLFAGSKSALTTLWRVDDQATKEFMKQFYHFAIQEHQPKAQALRSAKLRFLHSGTALANPAHWAAFVLNGNGMDPMPRFLSWAEIAIAATAFAVISALAALGFSRYRRRVHRINRSECTVAQ